MTAEDARRIVRDGDIDLLIAKARDLASEIQQDTTQTQVRKLFGEVRRIEMTWSDQARATRAFHRLRLLEPRLRYQAARDRSLTSLANALTTAIREVGQDRERLRRFREFFEAIVAYSYKGRGSR